MDARHFRALLNMLMVCDPWPGETDDRQILEQLANEQAKQRGFDSWVDAYHSNI